MSSAKGGRRRRGDLAGPMDRLYESIRTPGLGGYNEQDMRIVAQYANRLFALNEPDPSTTTVMVRGEHVYSSYDDNPWDKIDNKELTRYGTLEKFSVEHNPMGQRALFAHLMTLDEDIYDGSDCQYHVEIAREGEAYPLTWLRDAKSPTLDTRTESGRREMMPGELALAEYAQQLVASITTTDIAASRFVQLLARSARRHDINDMSAVASTINLLLNPSPIGKIALTAKLDGLVNIIEPALVQYSESWSEPVYYNGETIDVIAFDHRDNGRKSSGQWLFYGIDFDSNLVRYPIEQNRGTVIRGSKTKINKL